MCNIDSFGTDSAVVENGQRILLLAENEPPIPVRRWKISPRHLTEQHAGLGYVRYALYGHSLYYSGNVTRLYLMC